MTREDRITLLGSLLSQLKNGGVLSWGKTANGYQWKCQNYAIARSLADDIFARIGDMGLEGDSFPRRFVIGDGVTLIIEPVDD